MIILKIYQINEVSVCEENPAGSSYGQVEDSSKQSKIFRGFVFRWSVFGTSFCPGVMLYNFVTSAVATEP